MPGRMTRAKAAEVAEQLHIDEDAVLDLSSVANTPEKAREPLGEITSNSTGSAQKEEHVVQSSVGKSRKVPKKIGKSRKNAQVEVLATPTSESQLEAPDETVSAGNELLAEGEAMPDEYPTTAPTEQQPELDMSQSPVRDLRHDSLSPSTILARSRDSTSKESHSSPSSSSPSTAMNRPEPVTSDVQSENTEDAREDTVIVVESYEPDTIADPVELLAVDTSHTVHEQDTPAPGSPVLSAKPRVIEALRKDTPTKRSTSNKENVEPGSPAASELYAPVQQTPPRPVPSTLNIASSSRSTPVVEERRTSPTEDAIEAIDALEDAIDKLTIEVPQIPARSETRKVKRAPTVRMTKAAEARLSLVRGNSDHGREPTLGRAGSFRQSIRGDTKPSLGASIRKPTGVAEKKETVIPHSKPRPISLSFPTPPPPPKSLKAPTTSTFQLSGERVAAKLKAAREERMKKETEAEVKRPAFKARPAPMARKSTTEVRQTASSRARESLMHGRDVSDPSAALKNAGGTTGPTFKRDSFAASRRISSAPRVMPSARPARTSLDRLSVAKRPSTASETVSQQRRVFSLSTGIGPNGAKSVSGSKGREVYGRAQKAKDAADKEKKETEEAAKRARAEAADRSRLLSREWAEKQKLKKAGKSLPAAVKRETTIVVEESGATSVWSPEAAGTVVGAGDAFDGTTVIG